MDYTLTENITSSYILLKTYKHLYNCIYTLHQKEILTLMKERNNNSCRRKVTARLTKVYSFKWCYLFTYTVLNVSIKAVMLVKEKKKVCMAQEGSCEPINVKVFCEL